MKNTNNSPVYIIHNLFLDRDFVTAIIQSGRSRPHIKICVLRYQFWQWLLNNISDVYPGRNSNNLIRSLLSTAYKIRCFRIRRWRNI